jgi:hypothetical protein
MANSPARRRSGLAPGSVINRLAKAFEAGQQLHHGFRRAAGFGDSDDAGALQVEAVEQLREAPGIDILQEMNA